MYDRRKARGKGEIKDESASPRLSSWTRRPWAWRPVASLFPWAAVLIMETIMFASVYDDFLSAAYLAGGKSECKLRIIESARVAINNGDDWRDVLDSLIRNRPEFFMRGKPSADSGRRDTSKRRSWRPIHSRHRF